MKSIMYLFLVVFIFSACESSKNEKAQEEAYIITNKNVLDLRDSIADFNEVQSSHISVAGSPSTQYNNYKKLVRIASDKELLQLTKDTNNVVVTYATFGLIDRDNPKFIDVFERFLKTDKQVRTMKGCIISSDFVATEIYYKYLKKIRLSSDDEKFTLQNDKQLLKLDSLAIANDYPDGFIYNTIFKNRIFSKEYVPVIAAQAFKKENIHAINYIFQHHKEKYKNEIINALKNYLQKETIVPYLYEDIFTMLHSFNSEELDALLLQELEKIKNKYGESTSDFLQKILQ